MKVNMDKVCVYAFEGYVCGASLGYFTFYKRHVVENVMHINFITKEVVKNP